MIPPNVMLLLIQSLGGSFGPVHEHMQQSWGFIEFGLDPTTYTGPVPRQPKLFIVVYDQSDGAIFHGTFDLETVRRGGGRQAAEGGIERILSRKRQLPKFSGSKGGNLK